MKVARDGGKIQVDVVLKGYSDGNPRTRTVESIVYCGKSDLVFRGYRPVDGYRTKLAYWRIPIYIKYHNFKKCDYVNGFVDDFGRPTDAEHGYP